MEAFRQPSLVAVTTAAFLAYTFFSCTSSSEATKELEKYDSYEFADEATFNRPYEETFRACVASVESLGFVITVSDQQSGEIQGEAETGELRAEEVRSGEASEDSGGPVVSILAAIAFALVMLFVSPGCESSSDDGSAVETEPETVHVYVITLTLAPVEPESTTVAVGAARFDYEEDEFVRRADLENKYLNHRLFDRIEENLDRVRTPGR